MSCMFIYVYAVQSGNLEVKAKLQEFLSDTKHTSTFLFPTAAGVLSKKLQSFSPQQTMHRSGSFSKFNIALSIRDWSSSQSRVSLRQMLVAVQVGPNYWCEELMSLNQDSVTFMSRTQLGRLKLFSLPYASIIDVVSVEPSCLPFTVSQLKGLMISTFSRQLTVLLRCDDLSFDSLITQFRNLCSKCTEKFSPTPTHPSTLGLDDSYATRLSETASSKLGKFKQIMGEKIGKRIPSNVQSKLGQVVSDLNSVIRSSNSRDSSSSHTQARTTPQASPRRLECMFI